MFKIKCFLFGHSCEFEETGFCTTRNEYIWLCHRCNKELDFYNANIKPGVILDIWLRITERFRDVFPEKCEHCGKRYKCDESIDHIPF